MKNSGVSERIAIYADGASLEAMVRRAQEGVVRGFTTNPTLMAKAGIRDYEKFARSVLERIGDRPISFEVFSDDFTEMERQAKKIASWGSNVYVKIPITNTQAETAIPLIQRLFLQGLRLNVTAMIPVEQARELAAVLQPTDDVIISVFAGRIADTGRDPIPVMREVVGLVKHLPLAKVLWASPREVLNAYQAAECGCHIITMTDDQINKLPLEGRSLRDFSLDTVKMFYNDARTAGFTL